MTEKMAKEAALGKEIDTALLITAKNPRGIPEIIFIVSPPNENHTSATRPNRFCFCSWYSNTAILLNCIARHSDISYVDLSGVNLSFILCSSFYKVA